MSLVNIQNRRNRPFGGLLDEIFNSSLSDFVGGDFISTSPSINIIEESDKFKVEVASPGLDKKDFDVQIDNDHLIISVRKEEKKEDEKENFSRREFNYTSFKRSFHLPETIDAGKIDANYKEGILTIALSKKEEAVDKGPREIVIG